MTETIAGASLLGLPVLGPGGEDLGVVVDVRLVQDGPLLGPYAALRIDGFVVGKRRVASRLGYDRRDAHGPWLVWWAVRWLLRGNRYVRWADVEREPGQLRSRVAVLEAVPSIR
jgi:hypothetical protein